MRISPLQQEINSTRDEVIRYRNQYKNSSEMKGFTYAALTTTALCAAYGVARCLFDIDLIDNHYFSISTDRLAGFIGSVSVIVGGFGLLRGHQYRKSEKNLSIAKEKLDSLMIELAKEERQRNKHFDQNHRN